MADSLTRAINMAIGAPAAITNRQTDETTGRPETLIDWQVRAVLTVLIDGRWVPEPHPRTVGGAGLAVWALLFLALGFVLGWWLL